MGRTSNFSFPIPGRKPATKPKIQQAQAAPPPPPRRPQGLSKAQRILGTSGDLNIDSPTQSNNVPWQSFKPRSSGMSIAISETTEEDDTYASNAESWDNDDRIHPPIRLNGKASSTLLGHSYRGDADNGDVSRRMRSEKSSSTLRSYYDRATTPLSVSQQTSASSARDLGLRKGVTPAVSLPPRSSLLHANYTEEKAAEFKHFPVKKKTSRLDISRLFHKKSKDAPSHLSQEELKRTPSILSGEGAAPRKPSKLLAKPKQRSSVATPIDRLLDEKTVQFQNSQLQNREESRVNDLYEHYENRVFQNPAATPVHVAPRAPEKPKPTPIEINGIGYSDLRTKPQNSPNSTLHSNISNCEQKDPVRKTSRAELGRPPWDAGSVNSDSSKATRTSRKSVFSSSNLQQNSILSLSSDDESSDDAAAASQHGAHKTGGDIDLSRFPRPSTSCAPRARSVQQPHRPAHQRKRSSTANTSPTSPTQNDNFLTIPLPSPISPRLSGPWQQQAARDALARQQSALAALSRQQSQRSSTRSTRSAGRSPSPSRSTLSSRSADAPAAAAAAATPRSSRLMAVTAQEQALLSALRSKRARMRDEILAEHGTVAPGPVQAPPSPPPTSASWHNRGHGGDSAAAAAATPKAKAQQQRVLLYLDRPAPGGGVETAEPSPDLSDFLSFGSDEDAESTPRSSWVPRPESVAGMGRLESVVDVGPGMGRQDPRQGPRFDRSAARLSAVGKGMLLMPMPPSGVRVRGEEEEGWGV